MLAVVTYAVNGHVITTDGVTKQGDIWLTSYKISGVFAIVKFQRGI
jgi:hypothetical protein